MNHTVKQILFALLTILLTNALFSCQSAETIVQYPDTPPGLFGGYNAFNKYVIQETNNAAISATKSSASNVQVILTISSNGEITAAEMIQNQASKGLSDEVKTEIIRLSENAPAFTPAVHEGKNVASLFVVNYQLN